MPYRICKSFTVESGHILSKHEGKCRFPHGHSRRIEVTLEAEALDGNEMVCDFKVLKELIQDFVEKFDHAICLNTADPHFTFYRTSYERVVPFEDADPTSELMAKMIFDHASAAVSGHFRDSPGILVRAVKIYETETSWAEYFSDVYR